MAEEVAAEVEALQAVYGDDCNIIKTNPPLLRLRLIPRTADLASQQFVEATIEVRAGPQYPLEPPRIDLIDSKGLDEERQKLLLNCVRATASELTSCSMLVALCEEAAERLSSMNHPDGDCPLCLCPLLAEDHENDERINTIISLPFMKLMSCFHCFHCECIIRWWNWLNHDKEKEGLSIGNCPVCRKEFHGKDLKHVSDLIGSLSNLESNIPDEVEEEESENLLYSDSEKKRRERFEATLKLQEDNNGLIEPKRIVRVLPGVYLPQSVTVATKESEEQQTEVGSSSTSSQRPSTNNQRNIHGQRKARPRYHRKPVKQ